MRPIKRLSLEYLHFVSESFHNLMPGFLLLNLFVPFDVASSEINQTNTIMYEHKIGMIVVWNVESTYDNNVNIGFN